MNVKYRVTLDTSERVQLAAMVLGGKGAFRRLKRAQILLAADSGSTGARTPRRVGHANRRAWNASAPTRRRIAGASRRRTSVTKRTCEEALEHRAAQFRHPALKA